ncbi:alcohol oxidase-like protein [Rhizoctonia solani AG-1 IA]|uniref:Alcohol oxidase-like protein n=1 Tax=Thanatephorus cucumeris (strain AG1-IA) TaxID=983506 RepID=L8WWQ6_THACA|nr:alcohol oxidase-like protein [Rhizoctonia solani AG-1 IA]
MSQVCADCDIVFVGGEFDSTCLQVLMASASHRMMTSLLACVAAGRLAKANPELHILLIEQGPNNYQEPNVITPGLFLSHQAPGSKTAIFWKGNKSDALNGRSPIVPTETHCGLTEITVSINFLNDFDDWKTEGWGSNDMIPLLRKMETYHLACGRETHGYEGPLNVSYSDKDKFPAVARAYLEVAQKRGVPLVQDKQDLNTGHGCQTGVRQDAAHRYIHPLCNNKRLHIMTATKVVRVIFEGTKATGIEVVADKDTEEDANQTPYIINARKLVVVSAGALGSPVVLQRSGVGEAERLKKLGIQVVSDLPVGSTYEDHNLVLTPYHVADDTETIDPIMYQDPAFLEEAQAQFAQGKGALATNWIDAGSKLRPTPKELEEIGPAFAPVWKSYFESKPDKPVMLQALVEGWLGTSESSALHTGREIARRLPQYRGEFKPLHPKFPEDSAARCVKLDGPPDVNNVKDIVYTPEDNKAIEEYLRQFVETTWHSVRLVGTVLMKPREQGGCVDSALRDTADPTLIIFSDLSIIPGNVGANTNSTALVTGEKAAVIIAEDLGLNLD